MQAIRTDAATAFVRRSFLFVPADSERKLARAQDSDADALIIDLEDSVAADARARARELAKEFLRQGCDAEVWVRINPLDSEDALADLRAVVCAAPAGIVLPKPRSATDAIELGKLLVDLEQEYDVTPGGIGILPIATERPAALFRMHEYAAGVPRLAAISWGAEDLSAAIGASSCRDVDGRWLPPYELARSLCLFAAAASGLPAVDTVYTNYKDSGGLADFASLSRRDGFSGMLAIHPDQVSIINEAFRPSAAEIERAQRIVNLFAEHQGSGTLGMDGEMLDRPHLLQARRILKSAGQQ